MNRFINNLTAKKLLKFWIGVSIFGAIWPMATLFLKLVVNDFEGFHVFYNRFVLADPQLTSLFTKYPFLNISQSLPFLGAIDTWHQYVNLRRQLPYYIRYSLMNLCVCILLIIFSKKTSGILGNFLTWVKQDTHKKVRIYTLCFVIFFTLTFQLKIYSGLWYSGICGWNERLKDFSPKENISALKVIEDDIPSWMYSGLVPQNGEYISQDQLTEGPAMYLHFSNGQVLASNYELLGITFAGKVFGRLYQNIENPKTFSKVLKHIYTKRQQGKSFFLPFSFSYPNHTPYMRIDYRKYPSVDQLEKVSFWKLNIRNINNQVKIERALLILEENII